MQLRTREEILNHYQCDFIPAITITQPYASLIAIGEKKYETRGWPAAYRGPLAIHASKGLGPIGGVRGLRHACLREPFKSALAAGGIDLDLVDVDVLPRGAVIAVATLADIVTVEALKGALSVQEREFGDYSAGRYAWRLTDVIKLDQPFPARGALGLWKW